jgi:non-homologous end joining protein Ku
LFAIVDRTRRPVTPRRRGHGGNRKSNQLFHAKRIANFDPTTYRDGYQEVMRELIEAKMKGFTAKPREIAAPPPVIDLMVA